MSWWSVLPALVGMAALWMLPGYALLWAIGVRGMVAWGAAAGVTTGVAGVFGVVYDVIGVSWTLVSFLAGTLVLLVLATLLGRVLGTWNDPEAVRVTGRIRTHIERAWLAGTWVLAGGVLALTMMIGMGAADTPQQTWDSVFHYNAVWTIADTGNASTFGGLAPMYGETIAPYYPSVWHALVAIAPGFGGVTQAANASSIVLGSVIWIAGLVALSRVVWHDRWLPTVLTPIMAATYVAFPAVAISMLGVWPFALSTACTPGALALLIVALRGEQSWRLHLVHGLGGAAAASGVVLAHGSGLFTLLLLAAPMALVLLVRQGRRYAAEGHLGAVITAAVVVSVGAVVGTWAVMNFSPVQAVVGYERGSQDNYWGPLGAWMIDHPQIYEYPVLSVNLTGTVLAGLGVWLTIRRSYARWLVLAYVASVVVLLLSAGPDWAPRALSGFWYSQPSRINQIVLIPAIVLAAGGAAWLVRWVAGDSRRRLRAATVATIGVVAISTTGFRWFSQIEIVQSVYTQWPIAWHGMLLPEEVDMLDRAAETLPEDAVVLGEPASGSPYLLARSGVDVVFRQLTIGHESPERQIVAAKFDQWRHDPEVCEAVRTLGVTHVYTDTLTFEEGAKWEPDAPGLREVQPDGPEFVPVDSGGRATISRFTGCDQP